MALILNFWLRRAHLSFHLLSIPRVQVAVLEELPVLEARTDPRFVSVTFSDDSSVQICVSCPPFPLQEMHLGMCHLVLGMPGWQCLCLLEHTALGLHLLDLRDRS